MGLYINLYIPNSFRYYKLISFILSILIVKVLLLNSIPVCYLLWPSGEEVLIILQNHIIVHWIEHLLVTVYNLRAITNNLEIHSSSVGNMCLHRYDNSNHRESDDWLTILVHKGYCWMILNQNSVWKYA